LAGEVFGAAGAAGAGAGAGGVARGAGAGAVAGGAGAGAGVAGRANRSTRGRVGAGREAAADERDPGGADVADRHDPGAASGRGRAQQPRRRGIEGLQAAAAKGLQRGVGKRVGVGARAAQDAERVEDVLRDGLDGRGLLRDRPLAGRAVDDDGQRHRGGRDGAPVPGADRHRHRRPLAPALLAVAVGERRQRSEQQAGER
jgi:hypothetical protein